MQGSFVKIILFLFFGDCKNGLVNFVGYDIG